MIQIAAYQVAQGFNIKKLRAEFRAELQAFSSSELFYYFENNNRYLYVFDYGVIVFANYDELSISEFLRFVKPYAEVWLEHDITEVYRIEIDEKQKRALVKNDLVILPEAGPGEVRIAMLNTGQSVALEYYEQLTDEMLNSIRVYTQQLEKDGNLHVSKKALLRYIGKVLNVKNSIVDNLYILDDPLIVWDDEVLGTLNRHLKSIFDTNARFKDLDYRLKIVEENLKLFTDLLQHKESSRLEWIIIILILIELLNVLFKAH